MAVGNHFDFTIDLVNGKAITFAPGADSINFDSSISAASLTLKDANGNLKVATATKSVVLKLTKTADITGENFVFQDGSAVVIGTGLDDSVTGGNDSLIGTCYGDQIYGLDGDDSIFAGSASTADFFGDKLFGGNGNDTLDGAFGDDTMAGGNGNDTYHVESSYGDRVDELVNAGTDTVIAHVNYALGKNVENLTLVDGANTGYGNKLANVIEGNNNAGYGGYGNMLAGDAGNDQIFGGDYGDFLSGDAGNDTIQGGAGGVSYGDRIGEESSGDIIFAGRGDDVAYGGADSDIIFGDVGNDTLFGDSGWDSLESDAPDFILGGAGNDLIVGGGSGYDGYASFLIGENGNDTIIGGEGNDVAYGGTGNDSIVGGNSDDMLAGENGNDTINGGGGNDVAYGGTGLDVLTGSYGDDILSGENSADSLMGGSGNDWLTGGAAGDTIDGGTDADHLDGGDGGDRLAGGDGSDTLVGGTSTDTMIGGYGDDLYIVDVLTDKTDESTGDGNDTVVISGNRIGTYTLAAGVENLDGSGSSRETGLVLNGNELDNEIIGTGLNDKLNGNDGADMLFGGYGDDLVSGGYGNDVAYGGSGIDTLTGGDGDDTLADDFAGSYGDHLFGIDGGAGSDAIQLAHGQSVDFSELSERIKGIESVDMNGHGENSLTIGYADVLHMSDATGGYGEVTDADLLFIDGGEEDAVFLSDAEADWSVIGSADGYDIYYHAGGNALLYIDGDVTVHLAAPS